MLAFVLNLIIMISLGIILYLVARTLPRIDGEVQQNGSNGKLGMFEKWIASEMPEKVDEFISNFLMKTLRKVKVFLLKIDNNLSKHLKKIKPQSGKEEGSGGFRDITDDEGSGNGGGPIG